MDIMKKLMLGVAFCLLVAGCKTLPSMGVVTPPPLIPGAKFVGMETCATCHEKIVKNFERTTHSRLVVANQNIQGQACESCHGPGSLHADAQTKAQKKATIVNPGKKPEACFKCHLDKKGEFMLQYHHPVPEGKMNCIDCHDPHSAEGVRPGTTRSLFDKNYVCTRCHKDKAGPWVYEHEALREGCTFCHNVHGSINEKMLKERDANLCLKCHYQRDFPNMGDVDHTSNISSGACFGGCCHTAVHGSNYNNKFLM